MSKLRILAVLVLFVGLASLELVTGFSRLSSLRARRSRELTEAVSRGHEELARRLRSALETCEQQTAYLAGLPDVAALLSAAAPAGQAAAGPVADASAAAERAEAVLRAFLEAFAGVESVLLVDADGAPRLQLGRMPRGGAVVGVPLAAVDRDALAEVLARGAVVPPIDAEGDARWPRLAQPVRASGRDVGWVVLSITPGPLQAALAGFHPAERLHTRLVPDAELSPRGAGSPAPRAEGEDLLLVTRVHEHPAFSLETRVPPSALDAAMAPLGREYAWIVGSMIGVTVVLVAISLLVLRLGQRAFRLHETEHYLRWIRRVTDRYRALMEGAADMILIVQPDGALREANAAARTTLGLAGGEAPGPGDAPKVSPERVADRLRDEDRERFAHALDAAAGSPGQPVAVAGLRINSARGPERVVDGHFSRVDLGDEHVVEVSLRDVTQQRAVERQLQTTERLSSLGLLTAGVAHEINNPLEGIGNHLALLERPDLQPDQRIRHIEQIRRGLHRIRDIVRDLLAFARPSVATSRADLRSVVDSALGMVRYSPMFQEVEVEREGFDSPLQVTGDAGRLEQVVLNLLLNAGRAMDGHGRVHLRARRQRSDDASGECVALEVADSGPGIPPGEADRLFDPFYSASGGTGLGLSVSFGIVEAHGGRLSGANGAEGGAVFTLVLPMPDDEADGEPRAAGGTA